MNLVGALVDKAMFPGTQQSYDAGTFEELVFIPFPGKSGVLEKIPCALIPYRRGSPYLIVYAHGNGTDLGDILSRLELLSSAVQVHVLAFDYPGYGCFTGKADMATVDQCMESVINFVQKDLAWPLENVVLFGCSIGTGPCTRFARNRGLEKKTALAKQEPFGWPVAPLPDSDKGAPPIALQTGCGVSPSVSRELKPTRLSQSVSDLALSSPMWGAALSERMAASSPTKPQILEDPLPVERRLLPFQKDRESDTSEGLHNPRSLGGLILQCPYRSIRHAAQKYIGSVMARLLVESRWNIEQEVLECCCPVLWIHGKKDELFDWKGSQDMYDKYTQGPKLIHAPENATHLMFDFYQDIIVPIRQFLVDCVRRETQYFKVSPKSVHVPHFATHQLKLTTARLRPPRLPCSIPLPPESLLPTIEDVIESHRLCDKGSTAPARTSQPPASTVIRPSANATMKAYSAAGCGDTPDYFGSLQSANFLACDGATGTSPLQECDTTMAASGESSVGEEEASSTVSTSATARPPGTPLSKKQPRTPQLIQPVETSLSNSNEARHTAPLVASSTTGSVISSRPLDPWGRTLCLIPTGPLPSSWALCAQQQLPSNSPAMLAIPLYSTGVYKPTAAGFFPPHLLLHPQNTGPQQAPCWPLSAPTFSRDSGRGSPTSGPPLWSNSLDVSSVSDWRQMDQNLACFWPLGSLRAVLRRAMRSLATALLLEIEARRWRPKDMSDSFHAVTQWVHRFYVMRFRHTLGLDLIYRRKDNQWSLYAASVAGICLRLTDGCSKTIPLRGSLVAHPFPSVLAWSPNAGYHPIQVNQLLTFSDLYLSPDFVAIPVFSPPKDFIHALSRWLLLKLDGLGVFPRAEPCRALKPTRPSAGKVGPSGSVEALSSINRPSMGPPDRCFLWSRTKVRSSRQHSPTDSGSDEENAEPDTTPPKVAFSSLTAEDIKELSLMAENYLTDFCLQTRRPRTERLGLQFGNYFCFGWDQLLYKLLDSSWVVLEPRLNLARSHALRREASSSYNSTSPGEQEASRVRGYGFDRNWSNPNFHQSIYLRHAPAGNQTRIAGFPQVDYYVRAQDTSCQKAASTSKERPLTGRADMQARNLSTPAHRKIKGPSVVSSPVSRQSSEVTEAAVAESMVAVEETRISHTALSGSAALPSSSLRLNYEVIPLAHNHIIFPSAVASNGVPSRDAPVTHCITASGDTFFSNGLTELMPFVPYLLQVAKSLAVQSVHQEHRADGPTALETEGFSAVREEATGEILPSPMKSGLTFLTNNPFVYSLPTLLFPDDFELTDVAIFWLQSLDAQLLLPSVLSRRSSTVGPDTSKGPSAQRDASLSPKSNNLLARVEHVIDALCPELQSDGLKLSDTSLFVPLGIPNRIGSSTEPKVTETIAARRRMYLQDRRAYISQCRIFDGHSGAYSSASALFPSNKQRSYSICYHHVFHSVLVRPGYVSASVYAEVDALWRLTELLTGFPFSPEFNDNAPMSQPLSTSIGSGMPSINGNLDVQSTRNNNRPTNATHRHGCDTQEQSFPSVAQASFMVNLTVAAALVRRLLNLGYHLCSNQPSNSEVRSHKILSKNTNHKKKSGILDNSPHRYYSWSPAEGAPASNSARRYPGIVNPVVRLFDQIRFDYLQKRLENRSRRDSKMFDSAQQSRPTPVFLGYTYSPSFWNTSCFSEARNSLLVAKLETMLAILMDVVEAIDSNGPSASVAPPVVQPQPVTNNIALPPTSSKVSSGAKGADVDARDAPKQLSTRTPGQNPLSPDTVWRSLGDIPNASCSESTNPEAPTYAPAPPTLNRSTTRSTPPRIWWCENFDWMGAHVRHHYRKRIDLSEASLIHEGTRKQLNCQPHVSKTKGLNLSVPDLHKNGALRLTNERERVGCAVAVQRPPPATSIRVSPTPHVFESVFRSTEAVDPSFSETTAVSRDGNNIASSPDCALLSPLKLAEASVSMDRESPNKRSGGPPHGVSHRRNRDRATQRRRERRLRLQRFSRVLKRGGGTPLRL